jgi:hypothetical protein
MNKGENRGGRGMEGSGMKGMETLQVKHSLTVGHNQDYVTLKVNDLLFFFPIFFFLQITRFDFTDLLFIMKRWKSYIEDLYMSIGVMED